MSSSFDEAPRATEAASTPGHTFRPDHLRLDEQQGPDGRFRLALIGELDLATRTLVDDRLTDLQQQSIVIDLSQITFIDAAGLAVLLLAIRRSQGNIEIAAELSPQAARLIKLAGVEELLRSGAAR